MKAPCFPGEEKTSEDPQEGGGGRIPSQKLKQLQAARVLRRGSQVTVTWVNVATLPPSRRAGVRGGGGIKGCV